MARGGSEQEEALAKFLKRLLVRSSLTGDEQRAILRLPGKIISTPAHRDIVKPRDLPGHSCLVVDGLAARFDQLANGRRQITALHIIGDFCDLHSVAVAEAGSGIESLTPTRVMAVPHYTLCELMASSPAIALAFWRDTVVDGSVLAKWLSALGRRHAKARLAHLLCEMGLRYEHAALGDRTKFTFPITQSQLADVLGATSIHINRVMQALRREGLLETDGSLFHILDWHGMAKVADFDPSYLVLRRQHESCPDPELVSCLPD